MVKKFTPEPESCASCKCWRAADHEIGECRRHPPFVIATEMGPISICPATSPEHYCGDYIRLLHS